jgi:hydroxyacylglutathione hydrolase
MSMSFEIKRYICPPLMTNAYVIYDSESREGAVIDPAPGSADKIAIFIEEEKIQLQAIFLTHSHWDHIADCFELQERFGLPIFVHPADRENVEAPGSDDLRHLVAVKAANVHHEFKDGGVVEVGAYKARVIHTPGHSPGGVCFYFESLDILFSGDTLFKGAYGTLEVATADPDMMKKSLRRLSKLDKNTVVYCGHGASTTIGAESWLQEF